MELVDLWEGEGDPGKAKYCLYNIQTAPKSRTSFPTYYDIPLTLS